MLSVDDTKFYAFRQITSIQDTVGAMAMDTQGILCAGVSSGGLSLKLPGRLGHVSRFFTASTVTICLSTGSIVWMWLLGPE